MILETIIIIVYSTALIMIFMYALAQLNLLFNYLSAQKKQDQAPKFDLSNPDEIPFVTIQLPVYNELYVMERLLENISKMEKIDRLNLINSCTGYKSANLIATKSMDGKPNVAIFSSVTHLGSEPALIGFIMRPTTVPRDTYRNIISNKFFKSYQRDFFINLP